MSREGVLTKRAAQGWVASLLLCAVGWSMSAGASAEEQPLLAKQFFDKLDQDIQALVPAYPQLADWNRMAGEVDVWTNDPFPDGKRVYRDGRALNYGRHILRNPWRYGQEACRFDVQLYTEEEFNTLQGSGSATVYGERLGPYYVVASIKTANPAVPELEQKITALILGRIRAFTEATDSHEANAKYVELTPPRLEDVGLTAEHVRNVLGAKPFVWSWRQLQALQVDSEQLERVRQRHYSAYHGKHVLIQGVYERSFEHAAIQGIWVQFAPGAEEPLKTSAVAQAARQRANQDPMKLFELPVRFWGTLDAARGGYGHLGGYAAELMVERAEVLGE